MKMQVITTVSAVLDLYWDLVSFDQDVRLKQRALEVAQKLYDDNRSQAELGTLPRIEVTRAAAEVSRAARKICCNRRLTWRSRKPCSRTRSAATARPVAWLDDVHIIPLDQIEVPKTEDLKPVSELIAQALAQRPELQQSNINLASSKIMEAGDRNGLLPSLSAFAGAHQQRIGRDAGVRRVPGGLLLGRRRDGSGCRSCGAIFPITPPGFSFSIPIRNRVAQADYVAEDLLRLRQDELRMQTGRRTRCAWT